jgi:hypothetical protein
LRSSVADRSTPTGDVPAPSSGNEEEKATVASLIRSIDFGSLWDLLCEILDQIRVLEGLRDESGNIVSTADADISMMSATRTASTMSITGPDKTQPALSSLTMRFMPLIECYLTVSGATLLKPRARVEHGTGMSRVFSFGDASSGLGRAVSLEDMASLGVVMSSDGAPASATNLLTPKTTIPGFKFRQHASFLDMQMDVVSGPEASRFIQFAESNKTLLNMILRQNVPLLETSFSPFILIPRCRVLLHFDIKRAFFKLKLKKIRQSGRSFGSLRIDVNRSSVLEDSFRQLRYRTAEEMRRRLSITFQGEDGIDAGGLTREWYSVLAKDIFNVNYCLFTATNDNVTFQPNPYSGINSEHLEYFKFVGRIIGKAVCDGQLLDAHFTRSFYKHMLGIPVGYHDLEALEPEYYKSLMAILEYPLDVLGLDLTFSAELNEFGRVEVVDLVENGRLINVTDENKHNYVKLIANHRMTTAIRKQVCLPRIPLVFLLTCAFLMI